VFSRRSKKETQELKRKYENLEDKYEGLQSDYDQLREETGERTNIRISAIETEIESMNKRVEKLATDSYEMHSELRDIKDSVTEMGTALKEIVSLYKTILTRYGTPAIKQQVAQMPKRSRPAGEPGDDVIQALERDQEARARAPPAKGVTARETARPRPSEPPAKRIEEEISREPPAKQPTALDELHRVAEESRAKEGEPPTSRVTARSQPGDRVDRVARRDIGRSEGVKMGEEEGFLRSLPKKELHQRSPLEPSGPGGDGWEETDRPQKKDKGNRTRMDDLLDPE
jgi:archaellum component FlaC